MISQSIIKALSASLLISVATPSYFSHEKWDDLRFPATRLATGAANPPTFAQFLDDGAGSAGIYALAFSDQGVAGNEEQVWASAQMPHAWKEGSLICPHVHWTLEDATDCNVRFCIEYAVSSVAGSWPATTSVSCADCPSGASATAHNLCDLGDITMTGHTVSAMVPGRIYRNSSHANDTCTGKDAWLHEYDLHYIRDSRGSVNEDAK